MSVDRLDILLEQARQAEPADDGFTEIVMQGVRAGRRPGKTRRRFITRPAILATAAVLATGGALAAAVGTQTDPPNNRAATTPAAAVRAPSASTPRLISRSPATSHRTAISAAPRSSGQVTTFVARRFKNSRYEWGYTSAHTAYVVDKQTGLRMVTETGATRFAARDTKTVTVTITNTTGDTMAISSQGGCAVSAAAWAAPSPDPSAASVVSRDPARAKYWECARGESAHAVGSDEFVLAPGGSLTERVRMRVGTGSWALAGICRCNVLSTRTPNGATLSNLHGVVIPLDGPGGPARVATPPIGVRAI